MKRIGIVLAVFLCLSTVGAFGVPTTYYVWQSSPANGPGTTWSNAFHTIQAAVNAADGNDNVLVTNGTYSTGSTLMHAAANRVVIDKPILVKSVNGPAVTEIQGQWSGYVRCAYLSSGATLSGFRLRDGKADNTDSSALVRNGGGALLYYGGTLTNCIIQAGWARDGGGVCGWYGGTIERCLIYYNTAESGGGGVFLERGGVINNSLVRNNSTSNVGGGICCWYGGTVNNCTVVKNATQSFGGGTCIVEAGHIRNTIMYYNTCTEWRGVDHWEQGGGYSYANCCSQYGNDFLNASPEFVHLNADWHLKVSSPCIDAGANAYAQGSIDFDGNPRIVDQFVDIGAYEFPYLAPRVNVTNTNTTVYGEVPTYPVGGTCSSGVVGSLWWTNGLAGDGGTFAASSSWSLTSELGVGDNVITVYGTNVQGDVDSDSVTITRVYLDPTMWITDPASDIDVYGTTSNYLVQGTADVWVVGTMWWTNALTDETGTFPAAAEWSVDIPLGLGRNEIEIGASNGVGVAIYDGVDITRSYPPPEITITNPPDTISVATNISEYAVEGTNNEWVVGSMVWSNSATGATGSFAAPTGPVYTWQVAVPLAYGDNSITVTGFDVAGTDSSETVLISRDTPQDTGSSPIHYVSQTGSGTWPFASWATAARSIQPAVDAAMSGETVLVSNGTYRLHSQITATNAVALRSVNGPDDTTIDADWQGRGITCSTGTIIDGFTIENGETEESGGGIYMDGGGTVTNCVIDDCRAESGGGIFCMGGGTVIDCTVFYNRTTSGGGPGPRSSSRAPGVEPNDPGEPYEPRGQAGGGIYCLLGGTVVNCTITRNDAVYGGGVCLAAGGTVADCTITRNEANYSGGGVYCELTGTVTRCRIADNEASYGGGVCTDGGGDVSRCTISDNVCESGGGAYLEFGGTLTNCLISGNSSEDGAGAGVAIEGWGTLYSCTIAGNRIEAGGPGGGPGGGGGEGAGIYVDEGMATVVNCILWSNVTSEGEANWSAPQSSFTNCCTTPEVGVNCVTSSPAFLRNETGDYRLSSASPCRDVGTNEAWMSSGVDLTGTARIVNSVVDIGAYEYHSLQPYLEITNPPSALLSTSNSLSITLGGTAANLVGAIRWTNRATGDAGQFPATTDWTTPSIELVHGLNTIRVVGTNATGQTTHDQASITYGYEHSGHSPVHYVSHLGASVWPFASWATATTNLQDAIDAAREEESVWVQAGLYVANWEDEGYFHFRRGVDLYGGFAGNETTLHQRDWRANVTVLSADIAGDDVTDANGVVATSAGQRGYNAPHVLFGGERWLDDGEEEDEGPGPEPAPLSMVFTVTSNIVDGFTITAARGSDYEDGGGVYCKDNDLLVIRNTTICGNRGGDAEDYGDSVDGRPGGGLCVYGGLVHIQNSCIRGNSSGSAADGEDPGFFHQDGAQGGNGGPGGGIAVFGGDCVADNSLIAGNSTGDGGDGGDAYYAFQTAGNGGNGGSGAGICVSNGSLSLANCTIADNSAGVGGLSATFGTPGTNGVAGAGGGVYCNLNADGVLDNLIVWGNNSTNGADVYLVGNSNDLMASYSLVPLTTCAGDPLVRSNVVDTDPRFADPAGGNYRLRPISLCIDAGDNALMIAGRPDLDGVGRPLDGDNDGTNTVDMGGYEFVHASADSDGDTLSDADEVNIYGTDPASTNTDGDAHSDLEEMITGSDGADPDSWFCVVTISNLPPLTVYFDSLVDREYMLLGSDDPDGPWSAVPGAGPRVGVDGPDSFVDTNDPLRGPFYRLVVRQAPE